MRYKYCKFKVIVRNIFDQDCRFDLGKGNAFIDVGVYNTYTLFWDLRLGGTFRFYHVYFWFGFSLYIIANGVYLSISTSMILCICLSHTYLSSYNFHITCFPILFQLVIHMLLFPYTLF